MPTNNRPRRNATVLIGALSNKAQQAADERRKRIEKQNEVREQLLPVAEQVLGLITEEQQKMGDILLDIIDPNTPDEQLRARLEGVRLHKKWLEEFNNSLTTILRRPSLRESEAKDE